jgi:lipopolysaccharide transport system permease protein
MSVPAAELPVSPATTLEPPSPRDADHDGASPHVERPAELVDDTADIPHPSPSAVAEPEGETVELVIEPRKGWIGIDWQELFRNRELLYFLVWRDIKVRYKQAVLGVGWAVLQPVVQMVVFTLIVGVAARLNRQLPPGLPYAVFVLSGLLPWTLFVTSLSAGGMSLVNQQHLLTKIYFPRLFIPTSVAGGALVDLGISALLFVVLLLVYGIVPTWGVLLLLPLLALTLLVSLGMSFLLSALTVTYRDFRFLIPFMAQIWMWVSFIAFPPSIVEHWRYRWVLALNPMYPIIAGYRKILLGNVPGLEDWMIGWHWNYLAVSVVTSVAIFLLGLFYFRRTERRFSDIA